MAAASFTTFADYFREEANDANRNQHVAVAEIFDPAPTNTRSPAIIATAIVNHPDNMCLLRVSTTGRVEVLHHVLRVPTPITGGGAHAGDVLALSGDIDPDLRSATVVVFEDAHLHRATANALLPTTAHINALLAHQQGADADNLLDVPAGQAADADWTDEPVRRTMHAPNWVASMLVGQDMSPAAAWRTAGAAILARPLLHQFDNVLRPLEENEGPRQEPVSVKKLQKGDACWATTKILLGWLVDSVRGTIELPPHRAERLVDLITSFQQRKRCSVKSWRQLIGELRSMTIALPGSEMPPAVPSYNLNPRTSPTPYASKPPSAPINSASTHPKSPSAASAPPVPWPSSARESTATESASSVAGIVRRCFDTFTFNRTPPWVPSPVA